MVSKEMLALGSNRSTIRELFEYGKQRAAIVGAENIYDYSLGNPSVPAPAAVNEAIKEILDSETPIAVHGYTSAVGDNATRDAIADNLNRRFGTKYTRDNLYLTCGAAASLLCAFRTLIINNESEIIGIAPFFPEYRAFVESNGGKFTVIPAEEEHFQVNFDLLEKAINTNTQAIIINTPNNPSGVVYSEETIIRLAEILERKSKELGRPIYLISDEPYRELVYSDTGVPFTAKYYKNTIVCYSYSKSLSLPGERIGYVLIPSESDDFTDLYNSIAGAGRSCGYVCAPSLMQKMIAKCADVMPDISSYKKNRDYLYNALTEIGYECADPSGAFYLFVKAPNGNADEFSEIAKKYDLLLVSGSPFGCSTYFRASYCVDYNMIVKSIPAFKKSYEDAVK
jgi:aspartate aminotransferase